MKFTMAMDDIHFLGVTLFILKHR